MNQVERVIQSVLLVLLNVSLVRLSCDAKEAVLELLLLKGLNSWSREQRKPDYWAIKPMRKANLEAI